MISPDSLNIRCLIIRKGEKVRHSHQSLSLCIFHMNGKRKVVTLSLSRGTAEIPECTLMMHPHPKAYLSVSLLAAPRQMQLSIRCQRRMGRV